MIIGIGGTTRPGSSSEVALRTALDGARACGADVRLFGASDLQLPLYDPTAPTRTDEAVALIDAITRADGVVISSPGYHGTVSGLVKNALDYVEDLASAERPYLTGLPVGCVSVAYGWQAAVNTLQTLRSIVHSLRGWPTPYGASVNALEAGFADGECQEADVVAKLELVGTQVATMAMRLRSTADLQPTGLAGAM